MQNIIEIGLKRLFFLKNFSFCPKLYDPVASNSWGLHFHTPVCDTLTNLNFWSKALTQEKVMVTRLFSKSILPFVTLWNRLNKDTKPSHSSLLNNISYLIRLKICLQIKTEWAYFVVGLHICSIQGENLHFCPRQGTISYYHSIVTYSHLRMHFIFEITNNY